MRRKLSSSSLAMLLAAGSTSSVALASNPTTLSPVTRPVNQAGHIYYNASSGEKIVTLIGDGQTAPADTGASEPEQANPSGQCLDKARVLTSDTIPYSSLE